MTAKWENLHFFVGYGTGLTDRGVRCHHLADDGETVLESFELPLTTVGHDPYLLSFWEYVRLYMEGDEEDLEMLASQLEEVVDVAERRETYGGGAQQTWEAMVGSGMSAVYVLFATPLVHFFSFFRWLGQRTNKIPFWPAEVEAECEIDPNDPYLRDRDHLAPKGAWKPPPEMEELRRRVGR